MHDNINTIHLRDYIEKVVYDILTGQYIRYNIKKPSVPSIPTGYPKQLGYITFISYTSQHYVYVTKLKKKYFSHIFCIKTK